MRFTGRIALVTGAGSGIGAAAAASLAREGARLILCGRGREALERTRLRCLESTDRAEAVTMDVRIPEQVHAAFESASRTIGEVDTLVLSHGLNRLARVEELDTRAWEEVLATNLTGVYLCLGEAARRMRGRGGGRIVIVSSVSGRPGYRKYPGFAAYVASKYALTGLVEVAAAELEGSGVGLALLCPAGVDTEMFRRTFPGARAPLSSEQAAEAILDLADPARPAPAGLIVDLE